MVTLSLLFILLGKFEFFLLLGLWAFELLMYLTSQSSLISLWCSFHTLMLVISYVFIKILLYKFIMFWSHPLAQQIWLVYGYRPLTWVIHKCLNPYRHIGRSNKPSQAKLYKSQLGSISTWWRLLRSLNICFSWSEVQFGPYGSKY